MANPLIPCGVDSERISFTPPIGESYTIPMKPHIQKLFEAMQRYVIATAKANYNVKSYELANAQLKKDLEDLGIADKFDWSNG